VSGTITIVTEAKGNHGSTLAKVPIFSGLAHSELAFLAQRAGPRRYAASEIVFSEGEACLGLYVVESGHIRIFKSSSTGREHVLSVDGPGSSVAELPVFDCGTYPASVAAIDDATLLFVSKRHFHALCLAHPQVGLKVLRVVWSRRFDTPRHSKTFVMVTVHPRSRLRTCLFKLEPRHTTSLIPLDCFLTAIGASRCSWVRSWRWQKS
jgi:CRP-like cAMP-binding protein